MNCRLVKLSKFSGTNASIYSVIENNESKTLFDNFINENKDSFLSELKNIAKRLHTIGNIGAREQFFKHKEGVPGDGVCALYDEPNSNLRLYCIRYGTQIIVLGSGGYKPKNIRALQEDQKLEDSNYQLRWLSKEITEKIRDKEITFSEDGLDFIGDLEFNDYEK
ncbi:hypothetical protein [Reichenbachiella sp.]|uniref:hypothetical protein n=1 Tax=Reichenbachiella sp. TaxID=2184521 RepID=UPI003BAF38D0